MLKKSLLSEIKGFRMEATIRSYPNSQQRLSLASTVEDDGTVNNKYVVYNGAGMSVMATSDFGEAVRRYEAFSEETKTEVVAEES